MDSNDVILEVEDLALGFNKGNTTDYAVNGLSFTLVRGKTYVLLGESGCGKSMSALACMQLLPNAISQLSGRITFLSQDLLSLSERHCRDIRGNQMAMIFQEPMTALNPVLNIGEQLIESMRRHRDLSKKAALAEAEILLTDVGIAEPKTRLKQYPHQLSGGMKQRIMIAIALACDPLLLVADEPTTALDVTIQKQVLRLIKTLQKKKNTSILFITHDLGVARHIADHILVMYNGALVEKAPVDLFFKKPLHPYSRLLLQTLPSYQARTHALSAIAGSVENQQDSTCQQCRFAQRCPMAFEPCYHTSPSWSEENPDHQVRCHLYLEDRKSYQLPNPSQMIISQESRLIEAHDILSVQDLTVHFPIKKGLLRRTCAHVKAVDGVSINLQVGKTLAVVGESGCGKTTLARALMGLIEEANGQVLYDGESLLQTSKRSQHLLRKQIQMIFQDPFSSMNPKMDVRHILSEGLNVYGHYKDKQQRDAYLKKLLDQVGLPSNSLNRYPHEFSGGQRQRIAIARALALEPKLIICDEPTSALDVSVQAQILNLLKTLQRELCLSYLFISHDISVVSYLADDIAIMYLGKCVEMGRVEEILFSPKHPYTKMLLDAVPDVSDLGWSEQQAQDSACAPLEIPSPIHPPSGCHFHPRCDQRMPICKQHYPPQSTLKPNHCVSCYLYDEAQVDRDEHP